MSNLSAAISPSVPLRRDRLFQGALLVTAFAYSAGYAAVGLFLLIGAFLADGVATRTVPWRRSPLDVPVAFFIGALFLSAWLSPHRPVAVGSTGLAALTIYLSFGALYRIDRDAPGFRERLLVVWVAGGVLTAVWGMAYYLATRTPAATPSIGHNAVGTTLLVALLLSFGLYLRAPGGKRLAPLAAVTALTLGVGLTFTRGAWLGTAGGLAVLVLLQPRTGWRAAATFTTVAAVIFVLGVPLRPQLLTKVTTISSIQENRGRVAIARSALEIFRTRPIIGSGLNTFSIEYPSYQYEDDISPTQPSAHNIVLNMAAEGGLLGLASFVLLIASVVASGLREHARSLTPQAAMTRASLLAAFVGLLVHQQFDGTALSVHVGAGMWMLAALIVAPAREHA
jgi:O-antigen ligase